jgi:hypothetical protein
MTRRSRRLLIALPVAVVLTLALAWLLWPRMAITRDNAAKITVGMTLAEVEAILGGPARDETTGPVTLDWDSDQQEKVEIQAVVYDRALAMSLQQPTCGRCQVPRRVRRLAAPAVRGRAG